LPQEFSSAFAGQTVLIADDDEIVRGLLRALLRVAGLDVVAEASGGERTLAAYRAHRPRIVCLDIDMPGMGGLEVLSQIRAMSAETIVLLISAETTSGNLQKAIADKADGVIAKPFNTARLMSEIERALKRRSGPQPDPGAPPATVQPAGTENGGQRNT
jgi:two-component system, chemotaxis family, chemotaxis protein CheY